MTTPNALDDEAAPRPARLRSFSVRNFRLFRQESIELHEQVTVFVGRNDVGKTSILDALYLYGLIGQKTGFRGPLSDPDFSGEGLFATGFEVVWEADGRRWTHSLTLDASAPEEKVSCDGRVWSWNPKSRELRVDGKTFSAKDLPRYHALAMIEARGWELDTEVPPDVYKPLGVLRRFVTPVAYLFEPSALSERVSFSISSPTRSGMAWVLWLQDIINRRDDDIRTIEGKLRELFPFFRSAFVREDRVQIQREVVDSITPGTAQTEAPPKIRGTSRKTGLVPLRELLDDIPELESYREARFFVADGSSPDARQHTVRAAQVSSGLLLALAHLCLVYAAPRGGLLSVEEPENGLNPRITFEMMRAYLDAVREREQQLLLTTHHAWWLDVVPVESIRVVTRDDTGAHVSTPHAEHLREIAEEQGVYPSEIVSVHGPEGLLNLRPQQSAA